MDRRFFALVIAVGALLCAAPSASAQFLGTFSWQQQPYCNQLVLNVTQSGSIFLLDGYDDQCGAATRAAATGTAFPNPNGTIGLGITIVKTPGVAPDHIDATVTLPTASGTWRDEDGDSGTFAFGANTGGPARETNNRLIRLTNFDSYPDVSLRTSRGTPEAPLPPIANWPIGTIRGQGWAGSNFQTGAYIYFQAAENWTETARGTHIHFESVPMGEAGFERRMTIRADGNVGIGVVLPEDRLDVEGDLRLGTSGANGCVKNNNGGTIVGTCASDLRFKRDVIPYGSMLERVARLRPVQFSWRAAEFANRGFGDAREDGLIAQDVEQVLPELVTTNEDGYKTVDYGKLPLLAIQAIKELKEKNDALERRLEALERQRPH